MSPFPKCRIPTLAATLWALLGLESGASDKPIKVFILSGQSNMVGAGKVDGGSSRWGDQFIDPVVSVYEGDYEPPPLADYYPPLAILVVCFLRHHSPSYLLFFCVYYPSSTLLSMHFFSFSESHDQADADLG